MVLAIGSLGVLIRPFRGVKLWIIGSNKDDDDFIWRTL
jgi:hypothetical protein